MKALEVLGIPTITFTKANGRKGSDMERGPLRLQMEMFTKVVGWRGQGVGKGLSTTQMEMFTMGRG